MLHEGRRHHHLSGVLHLQCKETLQTPHTFTVAFKSASLADSNLNETQICNELSIICVSVNRIQKYEKLDEEYIC